MSLESLLDLIRQRFSPSEGQTLIQSLGQDPLVWQFVQDEEMSGPYFSSAENELAAYSPARMASWLIEQKTDVSLGDLQDLENKLPQPLRQRAAQAFETVLNTGLPPADLMTAGLLALTLRERRILKGNWKGLANEIIIQRNQKAIQKNFRIWQTPFACLFHLCSDFDDLVTDFIHSKSSTTVKTAIPVFIHTFLANALDPNKQLEQLYSFAQNLSIDSQLESLKWLETFHQPKLRTNLAKNLIQTRNNVDLFAKTFSELEAFETSASENDSLSKQVRFTLPEDVNRLAAFYFYSGNNQKAAETYQRSSDLLEFVKAQSIFQSLNSRSKTASHSEWLKIIQSVPNSKQARFYYVKSLIEDQKIEEASKYLEELPTSPEKQFLEIKINEAQGAKTTPHTDLFDSFQMESVDISSPLPGYFVHDVKLDHSEEILKTFITASDTEISLAWIEKHLDSQHNNQKMISLARDVYEKSNKLDKAIEMTSLLERVNPDDKTHKSELARLYGLASRWEDAFACLQGLVKSDSSPGIKDLERFAEAALKTDRIDMAISICHNILKDHARDTKALVLLGEGYMLKGDVVKSIQHMEQVVEMIPDEAETWLTLARLWRENGQVDRAFEILNKGVLALPNDPDLLHALGRAHLEKQAPSDALIHLNKAYEIDQDNVEIKLDLAQANYQLGQYEKAFQLLESFMDRYESNPPLARLLGHVLLATNKEQEAEPLLIYSAKQFPEDLQTVLAATRVVLDSFETSLEEQPQEGLIIIQNILEEAQPLHRDDSQIKLHLADIERLQGNYQNAIEIYSKLSESGPFEKSTSNWRLSYGLGQSAIALGDHEMGLAALQEAATKQPENITILHALAEAYQHADLDGKAHEIAKSALKMAPQELKNILWYANFKNKNNEPDEAVKALKEALQINPERSELKIWLSKILISMGSMDESKETIADLIENDESTSEELHQAAYICVHLSEINLAINALEKAYQMTSELNPKLLMDLAVSYSLGDQPKKALETLNLDKDVITQNPSIALLKSDLLSDLGQYKSALSNLLDIETIAEDGLKEFQAENDSKEQSPLLYTYDFSLKGYLFRLGQLSRATGDLKGAQIYLSKALNLVPDDALLRNACVEAFMVGLEFEKALEIANEKHLTELNNMEGIGRDRLDLFCSQVEILFYQKENQEAISLINKLSPVSKIYPRYFAVQSRLAAELGEMDIAKDHLGEAISTYQMNLQDQQSSGWGSAFKQVINLNSIAEASLTLGDYQTAFQFHQMAQQILNNQPLQKWRHASTLMKGAEQQQIAHTLSITAHAPGQAFLSQALFDEALEIINSIKEDLPQAQWMCLKARTVAAFTGEWPLSLNAESCIFGPEEAASIIIGSDDLSLVNNILETYPEDPQVQQAYGLFALRQNKDDGIQYVEQALRFDTPNPINHALLAMLNLGEPEQALKSLTTALKFWPKESEWHALAADLFAQTGDTKSAAEHIDLAINTQPENPNYWQKSADIKLKKNDLSHAKEDLERSAFLRSNDPGIWVKMADVNRRLGNMSEAIENIRTASDCDPDDTNIATKEVQFLLEQQNYKDAEFKAAEILKKNKTNDSARILLAQARAKQGKFELALKTLYERTKQNPNNISLALETLKIKKDQEGLEAILPKLVSLAHDHPKDPAVLTTLTDWLIQANRLKEAEETAQTILKVIPDQADVYLMLGRLQRMNGQLDQAISHLSDAITLDPNLVEAYIELGKTYQERRDIEQAIQIFQKGSQANASDPRPYYYAGLALKECKDYTGAEKMLKQAKRYSPEDTNIIRQLGVITALNLINNLRETR